MVYINDMTNKTNRTKEQIHSTRVAAERILANGRFTYEAVGEFSLEGIISNTGIMHDELLDGALTADEVATNKSEAAWEALMPEIKDGGPQLRLVGETAVSAHVEVQSISTQQIIPVHVEHAAVA